MAVKKPEELSKIDYKPPKTSWMDTPTEIRKGIFCWGAKEKSHFFIGGGDPKNMPGLRAELLRSIYRKYLTTPGKVLGKIAGARELTPNVLKELWYYAYQCTECRRCSLFCPYGIDTAEVTILIRELTNLLGLNIEWIAGPVANCWSTGNHMGLLPHTIIDTVESFQADIETLTGIKVNYTYNRKGAEVLLVNPSGEYFDERGTYVFMGYMMLLHEIGLAYTLSTYCSEGGNFGFFSSNEIAKRLHSKIYAEAKRLKVKWILGGEWGNMRRGGNKFQKTGQELGGFFESPV